MHIDLAYFTFGGAKASVNDLNKTTMICIFKTVYEKIMFLFKKTLNAFFSVSQRPKGFLI